MTTTCLQKSIALLIALPFAPGAAGAAGAGQGFSLELTSGVQYDSNVAVLDLDRSSGEGDMAALIDLGLAFERKLTQRFDVDVGYAFSQSLHDEFGEFDIRLHRGSGGLGWDFGPLKAGATVQYADAALDGEDFLVLRQAAPSLSRLFGERLFLRLAWTHTDKEFRQNPGRDATAQAPSLDAFWFFDGGRSHVVVGYQRHDEDAADDQFDHSGPRSRLQLSRRFGQKPREITLRAGVRHEIRDYAGPVAPLSGLRQDRRTSFETRGELPLGRRLFLRAAYEYARNRSDLASVDFDEHVVSLNAGAKL